MADSEVLEAVDEVTVFPVSNEESVSINAPNTTTSIPKLPQKRFFRQRAHANPFSDHLLE